MTASIDAMMEAIAPGFAPETAGELREVLEGLPEYLGELAQKMHMLAEFLGQEGVITAGERVNDIAVHIGSAHEAATEAFLALQDSFWMRS